MSDYSLVSCPGSPCASSSAISAGMEPSIKAKVQVSEGPAAANTLKPKITMRPITTPINILVCGASSTGKSSFIRTCARLLNPEGSSDTAAAAASSTDDAHAVLMAGADDFATTLKPILVPEAGRALVYKFQDCPGYGASLNPASYLEALLTFLYKQQERDYKQLHGSRGMHKSLACGCLQHSITACLYFLPPHGPVKLDLVMMAALAKRVALLPVVGKADAMNKQEAAACVEAVWHMLAEPHEYVAGLNPIETYRLSAGCSGSTSTPRVTLPLLSQAARSFTDSPLSPCDGLVQLVEVLTGDEVYGLLDLSWDKYTHFCDDYEYQGFTSLLEGACKADIHARLATANADELNEVKQKLQAAQESYEEARSGKKKACEDLASKLSKEKQLLDELWGLLKALRHTAGYGRYTVSQYLSGKTISAELKQRLPGLN